MRPFSVSASLVAVLTSIILVQATPETNSISNSSAGVSACCAIFKQSLPGKTFFPQSPLYQSQEVSYYSSEQTDLKPTCRVSPTSPADVSFIIKTATHLGCQFAVRSGGHMNWKGSSNVGPSGFTIDLENMDTVTVSKDRSIVSIASGCTWGTVYSALDPMNLTAVGGRTSGVGVGGYLLGGGISFLSLAEGFGSDNIINYEVVLADGTIANVNQTSRSDLYFALKYGSTNYGVVTRFDVTSFPLGTVWGGSIFYNISDGLPLLGALVDFTEKLAQDPKGLSAVSFIWNAAAQDYIIWSANLYLKPVAFPPLFSDLLEFTPTSSTMRFTNLQNVTDEIQSLFQGGNRARWFTLTLKSNAQIMWDIFSKYQELLAPFEGRKGFSTGFTVQPINVGLITAGSRNGGNPMGMSTADGNQLLMLGSLFWSDPADDVAMNNVFLQFTQAAQSMATASGLLTRFLYMNYALGTQDILGHIGATNLAKMKAVQKLYDPHNSFGTLWKGGFKL